MTLLWMIIGIVVIAGGVWYMKKSKKPPVPMNPPQRPPMQPPPVQQPPTGMPPSMPGM